MPRSIGFVMPFGQRRQAYFPDTLLGLMCAASREAGVRAEMVRVYFEGHPSPDDEVRARLRAWLDARDVDVVVVDRLFDRRAFEGRRVVLVTRGDSVGEGADVVIGTRVGTTSRGTRRTPTPGELLATFRQVVLEGVAQREDSVAEPLLRYAPVLDHDVIALGEVEPFRHRTLFGNQGCPYGAEPEGSPLLRTLTLPERLASSGGPLAKLGCAFCAMGGDYEKRDVVSSVIEQARFVAAHAPETERLILDDQYAIPYLARLMESVDVRPMRWLFAARADTLVRERDRLAKAIDAAEARGHVLELYLTGFESFCDVELERYNKGLNVADLLAAVRVMRELEKRPGFAVAEARGHSLILWNPWTRPRDVMASVEVMRREGLASLFDEVGRNRLRLYPDLPLYWAAERDGALTETWEGHAGAGRKKGYSTEHPWRFLDPRTAKFHELSELLREELGHETELAQLAAAGRAVQQGVGVDAVRSGLGALRELLEPLFDPSRKSPTRGRQVKATPVPLWGPCNDNCPSCPNRDRWPGDVMTGEAPALLCGREPTLHPELMTMLRGGAGMVTNGRRFAYRAFAKAARDAGLRAASVKIFAASAKTFDGIVCAEGAWDQAWSGWSNLAAEGIALEARLVPHVIEEGWVSELGRRGVAQSRLEIRLDAIGLGMAPIEPLRRLIDAHAREGVALEVVPLTQTHSRWMPA